MKNYCLFFLLFLANAVFAQEKYSISVDLNKVVDDKVKVTVVPPKVKEDRIAWIVPKVIPGSYSVKDFGRFVEGFTAFDIKGKPLKTSKEGNNLFYIENAKQLAKIEYWVNDTWDASNDNFIFQPGGTQIDAGKSFVINHQGFWGYLNGYKMLPYEISVRKPKGFYGATNLEAKRDKKSDIFYASSYVKLVDNPIMYSLPDTLSFMAGKMRVHIAVFSANGAVKASQIQTYINPLAKALKNFFGELPVDNYHFLFYFCSHGEPISRNGGYGALEHSYCSFYFLPEMSGQQLRSTVQDVASHEFLHILTPLNVHSEEIEFFDFYEPKMSAHLWMYEGITEYFAHLAQLQDNIIDFEKFMGTMSDKIREAKEYKEVSFTEMSRNILSPEYKNMYANVYSKGALIGFLLDIRILELSKGEKSLQTVMMALAKKYGPSKPFKDNELIDEFVALSHPDIREFFVKYVQGSEMLPYEEYFKKIGCDFKHKETKDVLGFGSVTLGFDQTRSEFFVASSGKEYNVFGLQVGDVIRSVNGVVVNMSNYKEALEDFISPIEGKDLTLVFVRSGKEYASTQKPVIRSFELENSFSIIAKPSADQEKMREWLCK